MNILKKLSLLLAIVTCGSVFFASCNKGNDGDPVDSSNSTSASDSASDSSSDSSSGSEDIPGYIAPPADDATITYTKQSSLSGKGTAYERFECREGYYEFTVSARGFTYYSFSISSPGQYALYTMSPVENLTFNRYNASAGSLNEDSPVPALVLEDGSMYSLVNCSEKIFDYQEDIQGSHWRATYGIKSISGSQTIKVRFVRVADPINEPQTIRQTITPTEIKGVATTPAQSMPMAVPFESEYFYDADYELSFTTPIGAKKGAATQTITAKGFYRLCERDKDGKITKEGDVIYAAIEKSSRLMDVTFAEAQDKGNALSVYYETNADGNYVVHDYISFITNDKGGDAAEDLTKACYMNVCNSDGLFPVNQELFTFLNEYVNVHPPALGDDVTVEDDHLWLAACSYYRPARKGSINFPVDIPVTEFTTQQTEISYTVTVDQEYTAIFHNIKWHGLDEKESGYYTITSNDDNAWLTIDNKNYSGKFSVTFEVDKTTGKTFAFSYGTTPDTAGKTGTFDITVTESNAVYKSPLTVSTTGELILETFEVINADGEKTYFSVYNYTAQGVDSILSLTTEYDGATVEVVAGADENGNVTADADGNVSITFILTTSNLAKDVEVNFTLTPAVTE